MQSIRREYIQHIGEVDVALNLANGMDEVLNVSSYPNPRELLDDIYCLEGYAFWATYLVEDTLELNDFGEAAKDLIVLFRKALLENIGTKSLKKKVLLNEPLELFSSDDIETVKETGRKLEEVGQKLYREDLSQKLKQTIKGINSFANKLLESQKDEQNPLKKCKTQLKPKKNLLKKCKIHLKQI